MAGKYNKKFRRMKRAGFHSGKAHSIGNFGGKRSVQAAIAVIVIAVIAGGLILHKKYNRYDGYKVIKSLDIESGAGSKYIQFCDFAVKYSSDGISYINGSETVWNDAYEMRTPMVDVSGDYLAIADKNTNDIYIYNKEGKTGKVTTSYPITKFEVAGQGVVAAMLKDADANANYIEVYDRDGEKLVSHKTLIDDNGYPLDFSLSGDGTKMIVSYMTINKGTLKTKVVFYDFSDAGKNVENRMVGEFSQYGETVVPTVKFISNDMAVAVGEDIFSIYKVKDKPSLKKEVDLKGEIQKVFFSENYIGLAFKNEKKKNPYRIEAYNLNGSQVMSAEISMDFDTMMFAGKNVLMYDDMNCQIISFKGVTKFKHTFKSDISSIIPLEKENTYLIMTDSKIEKVRLK